jgi:Tol biopolymer transport system component
MERLNVALEGRYRIERELGEGGMATVFLAEDLKHARKVALKVLKPELAAVVGGERFLAEIKTTANLSHPNILPLFDSGEADGFLFYVMPYVQGDTLRDRLNREKQLGVDDAVRIAREVGEALHHAHEQGVVHRDVKPANILLHADRPLVSDFGIALAVSQAGDGRLTETGLSMGTPHYMSPEQATGDRDVDPRTDVYSLGCVLFELLTGEPPYGGGTAQAVLARILTERPDRPTKIRATIPRHVEAVILKSMEKLPADRFDSAGDLVRALGDRSFRYGEEGPGAAEVRRWKWISAAAGVLAIIGSIAALAVGTRPAADAAPPTSRGVFAMPGGQGIVDGLHQVASFAPDGSFLVYSGPGPGGSGTQLWWKDRDEHTARPIGGTADAQHPEVDPTGSWVAYTRGGELRKISLAGGPSALLASGARSDLGGIAWLDDDRIAFTQGGAVVMLPADGGALDTLYTAAGNDIVLALTSLPGGGLLFVWCGPTCSDEPELWGWRPSMAEPVRIAEGVKAAWYVDSGHLVLVRGIGSTGRTTVGSLFAVPFDPETFTLDGEPTPLLEGIQIDNGIIPDVEVGRSGQLLARLGSGAAAEQQLYWVGRSGERSPVDDDFVYETQAFPGWALSPDGRRLAFTRTTDDGSDIWIKELDDGPVYRVTFHERADYRPAWHPGGDSVLFVSERSGDRDLYARRANATGQVALLIDRELEISQGTWSPDGQWLIFREGTGQGRDIWMLRRGDTVATPLLTAERYDEKAPEISPDGRWIVYESDEAGRDEVYVRPFPNVDEGKWQVSVGGGQEPRWAHSGRELFYVRGDRTLMAASIDPGPPFTVLEREELFDASDILIPDQEHTAYDIDPTDQRFIFSIPSGTPEEGSVYWMLTDHWLPELTERLGGATR